MSDKIEECVQMFCDGVNYYVSNSVALPIEFWLLRVDFEPWLPIHSAMIAKLMGFMVSNGWQFELIYDYL